MLTRTFDIPLTSNGYHLDTRPERLGWLTPSDPAEPISTLRERLHTHGYLWLKGLLPREDVLEFRRRVFEALRPTGLLAEGSDAMNGLYSGGLVNKGLAARLRHEIHRWAAYEAFCLLPPIWQFYEALFGQPVYLHKRKLIRYTTNDSTDATGAHYDLTYLRGGTDSVLTSWIPIGDIPVEMGGLVYLENSDHFAREKEAEHHRVNAHLPREERIKAYDKDMMNDWLSKDLPALADALDTRWLLADYEAGDMMVHTAYMIHAATVNTMQRMRLSTDIRYQSVHADIDERWSNHWSSDDML